VLLAAEARGSAEEAWGALAAAGALGAQAETLADSVAALADLAVGLDVARLPRIRLQWRLYGRHTLPRVDITEAVARIGVTGRKQYSATISDHTSVIGKLH